MASRVPVSIVTVFNDAEVRRECLDRSIRSHLDEAPETEYIPVDNSDGRFASAGAALNHGAAAAINDYVAFVHQDVYLHSLAALERAAGILAAHEEVGLVGAVGPTLDGRFVGRVRDRVMLLGDPARAPTTVDCVDELLFIVRRTDVQHEPLSEDPAFAWHAYALEYGLRMRAAGRTICAIDTPLTHNSLTGNLDRLGDAYRAIEVRYSALMPVHTPQGLIGTRSRLRDRVTIGSSQRWRYRWIRESVTAAAGFRAHPNGRRVLADIRLDIDELLASLESGEALQVMNVDAHGSFVDESPRPLELSRRERRVRLSSVRPAEAVSRIRAAQAEGPLLVTNLSSHDLVRIAAEITLDNPLVGFRTSTDYWLLLGLTAAREPAPWASRQAMPLPLPAFAG